MLVCKEWVVAEYNKEIAKQYAKELGLDEFISLILVARGFRDPVEIEEFLFADESMLNDPFLFPGMQQAVDRINYAIEHFQKIAIYGDYDVDGVTSTAMLYDYLAGKQADVLYYIPERGGEGYGMNIHSVNQLSEMGVQLIITVDNGISALEEIDYAKSIGIDVVVTDHHLPGDVLPNADAVINPHRRDCMLDFKDFAGVGVTFKLLCALEKGSGTAILEQYGEFIALGTIADIMPLTAENRIFVKIGLQQLENSRRPGIQALLTVSGASQKKVTAGTVAYTLAPRVNAAGRMGKAIHAVQLLLEKDFEKATALAEQIQEENTQRQHIETEIVKQAIEQIENQEVLKNARVLVVTGENWHAGVLGIVASRLCEHYGKPAIVISTNGDADAVGSGRSIRGFSLFKAIEQQKDMLVRFGGHELAAGITIKTDQIANFSAAVNIWAREHSYRMPFAQLKLDCKLNPAGLNLDTAHALSVLEPFGSGNPTPVFGLYNLKLQNITPVGNGKHLRLDFLRDDKRLQIMYFGHSLENFHYKIGDVLNAAVTLDVSEYRGQQKLSVIARDLRSSEIHQERLLESIRLYENLLRMEPLDYEAYQQIIPDRNDIVRIYKYLRQNSEKIDFVLLCARMQMDYAKMRLAIDILSEMELITVSVQDSQATIQIIPVDNKVDLDQSKLLQRLRIEQKEVSA